MTNLIRKILAHVAFVRKSYQRIYETWNCKNVIKYEKNLFILASKNKEIIRCFCLGLVPTFSMDIFLLR